MSLPFRMSSRVLTAVAIALLIPSCGDRSTYREGRFDGESQSIEGIGEVIWPELTALEELAQTVEEQAKNQ